MRFGPHILRQFAHGGRPSIVDHIRVAREASAAHNFTMNAGQVFLAGPRNMKVTIMDSEIDELHQYMLSPSGLSPSGHDSPEFTLIAHGTYMDNPWGGNAAAANQLIREELNICRRSGIAGLVVHLPKRDIATVVAGLGGLFEGGHDRGVHGAMHGSEITQPLIYLETPHFKQCAGSSTSYVQVDEILDLFRHIREGPDRRLSKTGFCFDTAHLWSGGVDISTTEGARGWLRALKDGEDLLPTDHCMMHLNDEVHALGSGLDKHERLTGGKIWKRYRSNPGQCGLKEFVRFAAKENIVAILERKPIAAIYEDYGIINRLK